MEDLYVPIDVERESWDELRRRIITLVNKLDANNLNQVILELFEENIIRGRSLLCGSCLISQIASPNYTDVIAALIAVVNSRFPSVGDLLLRRLVLQIRQAYDREDKPLLSAVVRFLAHLVNHRVVRETVALELLDMLLGEPSGDNVEVAVTFVKECGARVRELSPKAFSNVIDIFYRIVREGNLDYKSQCLVESLRRCNFESHQAVRPELDLLDEQVTNEISLFDEIDPETSLDVFKPDPEFHQNEMKYEQLKKKILGEEETNDDHTETNLVGLRREIYHTIMSGLNFEEAVHKLLQIRIEPGQEIELCIMILGCCIEERTYRFFYGHLAHRFCLKSRTYMECFRYLFVKQYATVHGLETNKLRNVAMFFAHLLATDALSWDVLANIRLTEEYTTLSSRIFVKILFQELSEKLGMMVLNERLEDPAMEETFESIFPRDHPTNMRFSIKFFTSIGLGGITEKARQVLIQLQNPEA